MAVPHRRMTCSPARCGPIPSALLAHCPRCTVRFGTRTASPTSRACGRRGDDVAARRGLRWGRCRLRRGRLQRHHREHRSRGGGVELGAAGGGRRSVPGRHPYRAHRLGRARRGGEPLVPLRRARCPRRGWSHRLGAACRRRGDPRQHEPVQPTRRAVHRGGGGLRGSPGPRALPRSGRLPRDHRGRAAGREHAHRPGLPPSHRPGQGHPHGPVPGRGAPPPGRTQW